MEYCLIITNNGANGERVERRSCVYKIILFGFSVAKWQPKLFIMLLCCSYIVDSGQWTVDTSQGYGVAGIYRQQKYRNMITT
jgi:hypothetical protein